MSLYVFQRITALHGELVGAVVGTVFLIILVYTVVLVTVIAIVHHLDLFLFGLLPDRCIGYGLASIRLVVLGQS